MNRIIILSAGIFLSASMPSFAGTTADKAVADIVKAQTKLHSLKSLTADIAMESVEAGDKEQAVGQVKCLKPNFVWIKTHQAGHKQTWYHISDGKYYRTNVPDGHWTSMKSAPDGANFRTDLLLWSDFYVLYATDNAKRLIDGADITIAHKKLAGSSYEIITAVHKLPQPMTMRVYIAQTDGLIHRMTIDGGPMHMDDRWSNIEVNPPLKTADFKPKY